jgi:hypothetical protein
MSNKFPAYKRLTHRYVDGWKCDEDYEYVGEFYMLKRHEADYGDEKSSWYGECWSRDYTVKAPRGLDFTTIEAALDDAFRFSCRCEHDCCGHTSTSMDKVKHTKRREYLVTVNYSVNC